MVVAYGEDTLNKYGGKYAWTIEYQCLELFGEVYYEGFNLYHREFKVPDTDMKTWRDALTKIFGGWPADLR